MLIILVISVIVLKLYNKVNEIKLGRIYIDSIKNKLRNLKKTILIYIF
jgi:hypothetical protein